MAVSLFFMGNARAFFAHQNWQPSSSVPGEFQMKVCQELRVIKQEVSYLQESMYRNSTVTQTPTHVKCSSVINSIMVTTVEVLQMQFHTNFGHLIESGSDVIAIIEHWLLPHN